MKRDRSGEYLRVESSTDDCELEDCLFFDYVYGKEKVVEESEEAIAAKLEKVERQIDQLPDHLKEAYFVALQEEIKQQTHYLRSRKFLLSFLRAENFDAQKTALRMAKFLRYKLEHFGPEMLPRRIRQVDLSQDDKKVVSAGLISSCCVDWKGRLVITTRLDRLQAYGLLNQHYAKNICRATMYQCMAAMEDDELSQKMGTVVVRWGLDTPMSLKTFRLLFDSQLKLVSEALPIKYIAVHNCSNIALYRICTSWLETLVKPYSNHMSFLHGPSVASCFSEISKYGIDLDRLPISPCGSFREDMHLRQIEEWRQKEEEELPPTLVKSEDIYQFCDTTRRLPPIDVRSDLKFSEILQDATLLRHPIQPESNACKLQSDEHLPLKLMSILDHNLFPDAIWWSRGGTAFAVEKNSFVNTVLKKEFKGIKIDSFNRRLKRWGFQRLSRQAGAPLNFVEFQHPKFKKNSPQLLNDWGDVTIKEKLPLKVMKIINSNTASDAIWWINGGASFAIEKDKFSSDVLEPHFNGLKFDSFYRMLKRWGFKRLFEEEKCHDTALLFHNPLFHANVPLTPDHLKNWSYTDGVVRVEGNDKVSAAPKGEKFLKKLRSVLESHRVQHAIWWVDNGTAIAIHVDKFVSDVLPQEYNGVKLNNFRRSLQRWGFKKTESDGDVSIFQHPSFRRDQPGFSVK